MSTATIKTLRRVSTTKKIKIAESTSTPATLPLELPVSDQSSDFPYNVDTATEAGRSARADVEADVGSETFKTARAWAFVEYIDKVRYLPSFAELAVAWEAGFNGAGHQLPAKINQVANEISLATVRLAELHEAMIEAVDWHSSGSGKLAVRIDSLATAAHKLTVEIQANTQALFDCEALHG